MHILELCGPTNHDGEHHTVTDGVWRIMITDYDQPGSHDFRVHNRTPHHTDPVEGLPVYLAMLCRHPSVRRPT